MEAKKADRNVVVISRPPGTNWARVIQGVLVDRSDDSVTLRNARQALYYSQQTGGELGLAAHGPGKDSRIGAAVAQVELGGVTFIAECSEAAVSAWKNAPVYSGDK